MRWGPALEGVMNGDRTSWIPQAVAWPIHSPEGNRLGTEGRSGSWPDWLLRLCGDGAVTGIPLPEEAPARRLHLRHCGPAVAVDVLLAPRCIARRHLLPWQRELGDGLVQGLLTPVGGLVHQDPWIEAHGSIFRPRAE